MLDRLTIERMAAVADGPIVVGLSGGGDSVALVHLLAQHLGAARLHAVIVDHALRAGSAADARAACEIASSLGVGATIQVLSWPEEVKTGQSAARDGRYKALAVAARRLNARVIAVAHTRDDQAETVLLRAARGSSWRGLAGMRALTPAPIWPEGRGLWLARPLLGARRADLRRLLQERGAVWIEDPANANEAFARVRARRRLACAERAGFDPMRLARLAERLAPHVEALDRAALALIGRSVAFRDQTMLLDRACWRGPQAVRQRALSVLVAAAGAASSEPPPDRIAELEAQLARPDFKAATLSGALLKSDVQSIVIGRDRGALEGRSDGGEPLAPLALTAGEAHVWDGRLEVRVAEPGWSVAADAKGPYLARGQERRPLAAAGASWLVEERVRRFLGGN